MAKKRLIFADLHAHNYREFSTTEEGVNTRLLDCCITIDRILKSAVEHGVDEVDFLGDLFMSKNNLDTQVIQLIMYEIKNLASNFPLMLLPGHHDYRSWSTQPVLMEILAELAEKGRVLVIDKSMWLGNVYTRPCSRRLKELNKEIEELKVPEGALFFGHQDVIGSEYGGIKVVRGLNPDLLSKKFKWSFLGHWHNSKQIRGNIISVGAPLQHTFSDMGNKTGWWIFDEAKDDLKYIENDFSPEFKEEIIEEGEEVVVFPNKKDFYRIKIIGSEIPKGLEKIRWKRVSYEIPKAQKTRSQIRFTDTKKEIITKYVEARAPSLTEEEKAKLVYLGEKFLL